MAHVSKEVLSVEAYKDVLDPAYAALVEAEQTAQGLWCFNLQGVPGLLHTEDYSRAVTRYSRLLPITTYERELHVELRLKRQWHVLEQATPPQMKVILDESVLHRQVGGPEVLREQLMHIVKIAQLPHIIVRVLPLTRPIDYAGDYGLYSFTLIRFYGSGNRKKALYREQITSRQSFAERLIDVHRHEMLFNYLWQDALSGEKSLALMECLIDRPIAQYHE